MEEQTTKVSVQGEDKVKNMYDEGSYFFSIHVLLQPSDPWEDKNSSLESEDYKIKDNCEGDEITPSYFVGEHQISTKEGDVVHDDRVSFG